MGCAHNIGRQRGHSNMLAIKPLRLLRKWISASAVMRLSSHLFADVWSR
jgi:hypothetical protein